MAPSNTTGSRATLQQLLQQMPGWKEVTAAGSHKVLSRIERCRTADLGYHAYRCTDSDCGPPPKAYRVDTNMRGSDFEYFINEKWLFAPEEHPVCRKIRILSSWLRRCHL